MKKSIKIIVGVIVGLGIIGAIAGGGEKDDKGSSDKSTVSAASGVENENEKGNEKDEEKKEEKVEIIETTAKEVLEAFDKNEVKGNKMFKDKRLKVTGIIDNIEHTDFINEEYILSINTGKDFELVDIRAGAAMSFEDQLIELEKGQEITVIIDCKGYVAGLYVEAELVEIVK